MKKLKLKDVAVKSFVTELKSEESQNLKGAGTGIICQLSQVDACVTAQICGNSRLDCILP